MFGWLGIIVGILLFLIGGFLVVFFPSTKETQPDYTFSLTGIILGFILLIVAFFLVFF